MRPFSKETLCMRPKTNEQTSRQRRHNPNANAANPSVYTITSLHKTENNVQLCLNATFLCSAHSGRNCSRDFLLS